MYITLLRELSSAHINYQKNIFLPPAALPGAKLL